MTQIIRDNSDIYFSNISLRQAPPNLVVEIWSIKFSRSTQLFANAFVCDVNPLSSTDMQPYVMYMMLESY